MGLGWVSSRGSRESLSFCSSSRLTGKVSSFLMLNMASSSSILSRALLTLSVAFSATFLASVTPVAAQNVSAPLTVTTLAGAPGVRQVTDGAGSAARFFAPAGLAIDASGNLIVADTCNNVFRKVTATGAVSLFVGSALDPSTNPINVGNTDGTGGAAKFHIGDYAPYGSYGAPIYTTIGSSTLGIDSSGNVYLADTMNDTIRKITPAGVVTTIAGSPGTQGSRDAVGTNATFNVPGGVTADSAGNVYVADSGNNTVRKIAPDGTVSTIAGTAGTFGGTDGTGAAARFTNPTGIAIDASGNLYVTDTGNHTVRKITPAGVVTTLAGSAGNKGTVDGSGATARFNSPTGIAVDPSGYVYVADTENHAIRKISPAGTVSTIAGTIGVSGSADGTGISAKFFEPYGVAITSTGTLYIADTSNDTIRVGIPATTTATLQISEIPAALVQTTTTSNVTLKVVATGSPAPTYQWSKDGVAISGATNSTLTLTSVTSANQGNYSVVVSSGPLTFTSAATLVQVFAQGTPVPSVTLLTQPADRTVNAGQSTTFTVEASSTGTLSYQWKKNGVAIPGATSATYTISSAQTADAATYAVDVSDGTSTATTSGASLLVQGSSAPVLPSITTQPQSQTVNLGTAVTLKVVATGSPLPTYQWEKNGTAVTNGTTIAGAMTDTLTISNASTSDQAAYTVVVTNAAGSVVSNTATVTVSSPTTGPSAWLTNVSVRATMQAGQDPLIVGLSMTGGQKPVLVRAAGPALATVVPGLTGYMADPKLDLYVLGATSPQVSDDDWDSSLAATANSVGAFPFTAGSKDAALVQSIQGGYTANVAAGAGGMVLVEAYDTNPTTTSTRLTNVSARNFVGTGDNILTAGFAIRGTGSMKLLIRGIGPTLANYGITNYLADPMIQVYDSTGTKIAENNDWDATLDSAFSAVGAFKFTSTKDAALIVTLAGGPAGATYTVQVKGADGGTGQGMVEVYELPATY
ncbi:MAG TPA: immunoglobulin domain-containing protein [Opitutaceae bacterium]|nr:immunoglobulin domain-containing protein [Opitutaceae bacterium]